MNPFEDYIQNDLIPKSDFWEEKDIGSPEVYAWATETIYKWIGHYKKQGQFFPEQFDEIREHIVQYAMAQKLSERDKIRLAIYLAWVLQEQFYDGMDPSEDAL